jgi:nucleotide-binding universal stress UspA family protein
MADPDESRHVPHGIDAASESTEWKWARNNLAHWVQNAEDAGIEAKKFLVFDKGNENIEHYIGPLAIDFVVMGSHGVSGLRKLVLGSNPQRLVRHAAVPVLVVKKTH